MAGPDEIQHDHSAANAAALEAITNAARAYATMAPNAQQMGGGGFPSLDNSGMLLNPAAAIAAVAAAAAKQLQAQQQQQQGQAHQQQQSNHAAANALMAAFGRGAMTAPGAIQVAAGGGNPATMVGAATLNHVTALLQSVTQHVNNQARAQQQQQQQQNLAATPSPPPQAASYTPPPPPPPNNFAAVPQQQQRSVSESTIHTTAPIAAAPPSYVAVSQRPAAHHHHHHRPVASASANVVKTVPSSALLPNIQNWSLAQLDKHVKLLHQMKQPVPQSIALLLADARRKEDKKTAKRVANRKSACTSRARKKALVEEMTRTNARLRRQALILSLLPDLVIVISQEGEITFCSAQVERALHHKVDDLVGADIREILIPASRTALGKLATELTNKGGSSTGEEKQNDDNTGTSNNGNKAQAAAAPREEENGNVSGESSRSGGASSAVAAVVSDQSFPLSVVKVDSKQEPTSDEKDDSDVSAGGGGKEPVSSSLTNSSAARSPSASSGSEDAPRAKKSSGKKKEKGDKAKAMSSSDDSSSGSTETKNVRKANENLERNVRWHNKKLKSSKSKSHKDDVLGDSVTPNNALARLSSLQHYPATAKLPKSSLKEFAGIGDRTSSEDSLLAGLEEKKKSASKDENASDDSGYRESNDSREEETASSASESSNSNGRNKPLAPTCNVCLIRDDLTSLWCEVTSSIRTKNVEDNSSFEAALNGVKNGKEDAAGSAAGGKSSRDSTDASEDVPMEEPEPPAPETIEFLLCLRPIRDGGKVDESLRFIPSKRTSPTPSGSLAPTSGVEPMSTDAIAVSVSQVANSNGNLSDPASETPSVGSGKSAARKRRLPLHPSETQQVSSSAKRQCLEQRPSACCDTEKSAVESLILMSNKSP